MNGSAFLDALLLSAGYNAAVVALGCAAFGLAAGAIGCFVLLRGRALVSDTAAHATLPGVAGAFILAAIAGGDPRALPLLLAGAAATAALALLAVAALGRTGRIRDDAAMALVLSIGYGIGVVLISVVQSLPVGGQAGLKSFILGQAAGMSAADATLIAGLAAVAILVLLALSRQFAALCFDRDFAASVGLRVALLDAALLGLMLAVAVAGLRAVGLILVVGLMVIPAVTARLLSDRLERIVPLAACLGAIAAWLGTALSAASPKLPTGATIALVACALFVVALLFAPRRGAIAFAVRHLRLSMVVARDHALRGLVEARERAAMAPRPIDWHAMAGQAGWSRLQRWLVPAWMRHAGLLASGTGGAVVLSRAGLALAHDVTRRHRVWEHYMQAAGGLAPADAHLAADQVEHALPRHVTRAAEAWLREHDAARLGGDRDLPPPGEGGAVPPAAPAPPR